MNITIHRGTHQIGGSVTEYEYFGWHLFVDYGEELPSTQVSSEPLEINGLTHGNCSRSALLITHNHRDHIGHITELPEELPIYMGKVCRDIQMAMSDHLKSVDDTQQQMLDRLKEANTFEAGVEFTFGPFTIMPITVDHSAFDAYAFKITDKDKVSVFHTGDFRTHGFRSKKMEDVLKKYIGKVRYVICEGTNIPRNATSVSEQDLQKMFVEEFKGHKGNVVYLSSTNIDRLFSLYHAAVRTGRVFLVDSYQKRIMDIVTQGDSIWGKSELYQYDPNKLKELKYDKDEFLVTEKFKQMLEQNGYVLIARANSRFDHLIERIPDEKQKYLSMWEGYVKDGCSAYNPGLAQSVGSDYKYMHTSGHCDKESLRKLFQTLYPRAIIPIHTDTPKAFADEFCNERPVMLLNDGDTISAVPLSRLAINAVIFYATKWNHEGSKVIKIENNAPFWTLDREYIGFFPAHDDAEFAIKHTIYRPNSVLGYQVQEEDIFPIAINTYDRNKNLLTMYRSGGHYPRGKKYQEPCPFKIGEKILAVFDHPFSAIIPATLLGPISAKAYRELYEADEDARADYSSFKDFFNELRDWEWDCVVIHPHVKIDVGISKIYEAAQRTLLFPYRDFDIEEE